MVRRHRSTKGLNKMRKEMKKVNRSYNLNALYKKALKESKTKRNTFQADKKVFLKFKYKQGRYFEDRKSGKVHQIKGTSFYKNKISSYMPTRKKCYVRMSEMKRRFRTPKILKRQSFEL